MKCWPFTFQDFVSLNLKVQDENENFVLLISDFETRTRILSSKSRVRDENKIFSEHLSSRARCFLSKSWGRARKNEPKSREISRDREISLCSGFTLSYWNLFVNRFGVKSILENYVEVDEIDLSFIFRFLFSSIFWSLYLFFFPVLTNSVLL